MTIHISARIAWHDNGWNGHICKNPRANTYCVGTYSYPGEMIAERRQLDWEQDNTELSCAKLANIPPCIYSINAFGTEELVAFADPPFFFKDQTRQRKWPLPPASVCLWPYEEMYSDSVKKASGGYDHEARLRVAGDYFAQLEPNRSLIFYYSNYSNPFSEEDPRRYIIVGVSRIKVIGDGMFYEGCSEETKRKFGGGYVWDRVITSHYPDEGFCLPYHLYRDRPDLLNKFLFIPDNPRNFKYGTRHVSDDDALDLVERFLEIAGMLKEMGDTSEDWSHRMAWLSSLIAELWKNRGLYPGMLKVLDYLEFHDAIPFYKAQAEAGQEIDVKDQVLAFLDGKEESISGLTTSPQTLERARRQWRLKGEPEQRLLRDVLPRFDLFVEQIQHIMDEERDQVGITATLQDVAENPYLLCEQYVGDGPDDVITFNKIDHGMFPSPELGVHPACDKDDWRRLRALCVGHLHYESQHSFMSVSQVINTVNHKLSFLPEWKRHQFSEKYLVADEENLSGALTFREDAGGKYVYLKSVYDDERAIEQQLRALASRPNIKLRFPVTETHWHTFLNDPQSPIAQKNPSEYAQVIQEQVAVCQNIFTRPLSVLSGGAGTGKTTIVRSIIQAIEKAHGEGTSFQLLAPTGKAADRLRERTGKSASTIHSFLARRGWLNPNFTFRRHGTQEENISTYIVDEASMLDLALLSTLFRAVNWSSVQRLIFVGDPNQIPPIGIGKVFADLVDWVQEECPENLGFLQSNIRQMENRITGQGTGISELAALYLRSSLTTGLKDGDAKAGLEQMLCKVQEGGEIDKDLRVLYWHDADELERKLIQTIVADMENDTGASFDPERPFELWGKAFQGDGKERRANYQQVISPYRGELFGIEHLNTVLQTHSNVHNLETKGQLGGITYFDKIIQIRNRYASDPLWAYNLRSGKKEKIEVFNGEIGFTKVHAYDTKKWKWPDFHLGRFQVVFSRKEHLWAEFSSIREVEDNLELAYAISVHKAQGSEFQRVYFILPKHKKQLLWTELFYTGITRAQTHCTLLVEEDVSPLLTLRRRESSRLCRINSSLFQFRPVPEQLLRLSEWYEEGKIHRTLTNEMVRSKSEVIIANMLFERGIPFKYEVPLYAPDGTFYLPDFTIKWHGEDWYWEHFGLMQSEAYRNHNETKLAWYEKHGFKDRLVTTTEESGFDSMPVLAIIERYFSN